MYVLYQKDTHHIELWEWNPYTGRAHKALLSSFTPAGVQMLPDQQAFSFIDQGRIRVKYIHKRQPKAIDINEPPVYNMHTILWLDEQRFYFSAQEHERFGIYQTDTQGQTYCLVHDDVSDAMYPQKVGDRLFYIERLGTAGSYQYSLVSIEYPEIPKAPAMAFNDDFCFEQRIQTLLQERSENVYKYMSRDKQHHIDFKSSAVAFLHMISSTEGFVVEFPEVIHKNDPAICFTYHHVIVQSQWHAEPLFTFSIPTRFLLADSADRLYESVLPFLPRHMNGKIFYSDAHGQNHGLNLYVYDVFKTLPLQLSKNVGVNANFFAPILFEGKMYFGGTIFSEADEPGMLLEEDDVVLRLASVDLNLLT